MSGRARFITGFCAVLAFVLIWDFCGYAGLIDADLFPPVTRVLLRAFELSVDRDFIFHDLFGSMSRLLAASVFVLPLAVIFGIWAGAQPRAHAALLPFVNFTLPLPKVAIFPLMLAIFGLGDTGKIVLIGIGLFYPLFINVMHGTLRIAAGDYSDLTSLYGIRGWTLWYQVYWKGLMGDILVGLKASLGYGFTLVIVSELSASNNGLGNFIWRSWDAFQILDMYAAVFWLCFLGWVVQSALDRSLAHHFRLNPPRS
jgi:NitT/TauT family transport system permease protein